jgi:hypothetical protein
MEYVAYLRDQAEKFRELAALAKDPEIARELAELAAVCEQVANDIEERIPAG